MRSSHARIYTRKRRSHMLFATKQATKTPRHKESAGSVSLCLCGYICLVTSSFPDWIVPMAATLTQERFTGPEWIFERKYDGIRLLAFKNGADVRLLSRNKLPQDLPSIARAVAELPVHDAILDGEVTWGRALRYHVFDIV